MFKTCSSLFEMDIGTNITVNRKISKSYHDRNFGFTQMHITFDTI